MPSILPYILKDTLNDIFSKIALLWNSKYAQHFLTGPKKWGVNQKFYLRYNSGTILIEICGYKHFQCFCYDILAISIYMYTFQLKCPAELTL